MPDERTNPTRRTHVIHKVTMKREVWRAKTDLRNQVIKNSDGRVEREMRPIRQGERVHHKFAGYAYNGCIRRGGKDIPVSKLVDQLNEDHGDVATEFVATEL